MSKLGEKSTSPRKCAGYHPTFVECGRLYCSLVPLKFVRDNNLKYSSYCFFGEDFEFYCQLLLHGLKLRLYREPLYLRRLTPGSLTTKDNDDLIKVYQRLLSDSRLNSGEKEALKMNLNKLKRQQYFNSFYKNLINRKWQMALRQIAEQPGLLFECLQRIPRLISYIIAAKRVGGKMRF